MVYHTSILRNKRLLFTYVKERVDRIQELRWTHRTLPEHVKANLSPLEQQYFRQYDQLLNRYMRSGRGVGLDLTADPTPPDDPYVQVRVLRDYNDVVFSSGRVSLQRGKSHWLPSDEAHPLIMDGVLELGALHTTGYTILYGLALAPMGLLADGADRPRLLGAGMALWSLLTMAASQANGFGALIATRAFFALAQGTQHPVCYALIPELFPNHRTAAMAAYNSAIYVGRALSFAVVAMAVHQGEFQSAGEVAQGAVASDAWRQPLFWLGPPGLLLAGLAATTLPEPRQKSSAGAFLPLLTLSRDSMDEGDLRVHTKSLVPAPEVAAPVSLSDRLSLLKELAGNRGFQALTAAAAVNDVASWALIGWQSQFYERVQGLEPAAYAPMGAAVCVGGLMGGVGAAVFGDKLTARGARGWLTAGTSVVAAPLVAASFLIPDPRQSFWVLLVGYALSECWRSPVAVMVREVSPPGLGSTASAVHLGVRGLAGALGPLGIAWLSSKVGLQDAMLLIPACHLLSGLGLAATERILAAEKAQAKAAHPSG
ncbi:DNA replication complex GINS PSF1 [Micractinium conductrix]|uniref:DNA replication complex GINS PSF1 n=1 Tax=Micractinium conductrix TaxID=554055 RepID=A0A2P6VJL8_9CHLO|nr:DNA replication complex GINS PSF1 [Micractinium conductrix]|eukprot:PSC74268.1 DNA replication complex GINS PSF1 [Micractinium conductrix]